MSVKRVVIALTTVLIVYLGAVFVQWDFNPRNWGTGARGIVATLALFFGPWMGVCPFIKD